MIIGNNFEGMFFAFFRDLLMLWNFPAGKRGMFSHFAEFWEILGR